MKKSKQKPRVTFEVPDDMLEWLEVESKINDTNVSWVIRRLIRKEMES